jgi:hypothetical protein
MAPKTASVGLDAVSADIGRYQRELRERGVSVIPGFVPPDVIAAMVEECDALADEAFHQDVMGTPYLELPDDGWPDGHPRVTWARSAVHTIGYDQFPGGSRIRDLYERNDLLAFLGTVLGREPLYRYADPIGALNVAVMVDGDVLDWHFDQTDFVVSLAIQSSDRGGDFENVALVREPDDEHYDEVADVLAGRARDRVVVESMTPGTLMLFEGRHSLHRVTTVDGTTPRYVALFGYDTKPDTMSSDLLKQIRYGRTEPLAAR